MASYYYTFCTNNTDVLSFHTNSENCIQSINCLLNVLSSYVLHRKIFSLSFTRLLYLTKAEFLAYKILHDRCFFCFLFFLQIKMQFLQQLGRDPVVQDQIMCMQWTGIQKPKAYKSFFAAVMCSCKLFITVCLFPNNSTRHFQQIKMALKQACDQKALIHFTHLCFVCCLLQR